MVEGYERYYRLVKFLKKELKFSHPVQIRRVKMPVDRVGDCYLVDDSHFVIRIDKTLNEEIAIDTLIHEAAHPLAWRKDTDDHGPNWGKAYSLVYRKFLKFHEQN